MTKSGSNLLDFSAGGYPILSTSDSAARPNGAPARDSPGSVASWPIRTVDMALQVAVVVGQRVIVVEPGPDSLYGTWPLTWWTADP